MDYKNAAGIEGVGRGRWGNDQYPRYLHRKKRLTHLMRVSQLVDRLFLSHGYIL